MIILIHSQDHLGVSNVRVGDEALASIENVRPVMLLISRAAAFRIGATRGFCDSYSGKTFTRSQTWQVLLLLFLGAE